MLIALVSLMANARCDTVCAFGSCSHAEHHPGPVPPCHPKAPASHHGDGEGACSHQILAGSRIQPAKITVVAPAGLPAGSRALPLAPAAPEPAPAFLASPPGSRSAPFAVLRI